MRFPIILLLSAVTFATSLAGAETNLLAGVNRIVFLGDSITYAGQFVEDVEAFLVSRLPEQRFEILNLGLPSETVSGLSEPGHAGGQFPRPDLHERLGRVLEQTKPDLVIACYGMNDGIYHPLSEERLQKFQDGMRRLHEGVTATGAKILHVTPPVFDPVPIQARTLPAGRKEYPAPYVAYNEVLDRYSEWLRSQRAQGWLVVDAHGPMNRYLAERRARNPAFRLAGDGVHPDDTGHWLIARAILPALGASSAVSELENVQAMLSAHPRGAELLKLIQQRQRVLKDAWLTQTGHQRPGMSKGLPLPEAQKQAEDLETKIRAIAAPFPGKRSSWNGFDRFDFPVAGRTVSVIAPTTALPGRPWAWKGEFLDAFPATEIALLRRGFYLVYLSDPDMLGCPDAVGHWNAAYQELTGKHGLARKPALIGLSRGGLYCYNWAAANPDKVACLYADAPVCDFKSWPGGKGKGKGSPRDWKLVMDRYHFADEAAALTYTKNPVDNLAPLASAKVPLIHVYGDADDVVPWDENTGVLAERYRKLGGEITLIAKPGVGHHPHGLSDPTPVVEFIITNSVAANAAR